jgi:DnaK suppressor protein
MRCLRQILVRRRDALRQALAGDLSMLKELRQQNSGDVIDAALDTAQDEISSQLAEVESRELTHIETALERMRKGNYGGCEGCGNSIPLARLQALPYATMCIQCQREAEKHGESGTAAASDCSTVAWPTATPRPAMSRSTCRRSGSSDERTGGGSGQRAGAVFLSAADLSDGSIAERSAEDAAPLTKGSRRHATWFALRGSAVRLARFLRRLRPVGGSRRRCSVETGHRFSRPAENRCSPIWRLMSSWNAAAAF